jgi:soluble lytic murein transglycosylase
MIMLSKQVSLWRILLGIFGLMIFSPTVLADTITSDRSRFLRAEAALASGQSLLYSKLKPQLSHYPLYPYLVYSEYEKNIQSLSNHQFQSFMDKYHDTPLAEQLRNRWLQIKAKQEDWLGFLKAYVPSEDISLQCHFISAELNTRKDKQSILEQILPLWLSGSERPKSCEAVFNIWEKSPLLTRSLIWQKIKLAIQKGNLPLARSMTSFIKKNEVALLELWIMVHQNPYLVTHKKYFHSNHASIFEILVHGVSLIAKDKPETAIQIWQQIAHQYPFTERHWGLVVRAIGLAFASQKQPEAEKWLSQVPDVYANQAVHESRIRVALAKEDWKNVLHWINRLPDALATNEAWQYWQARALEKVNELKDSQILMQKLAQTRGYYGFLASQHLQKPYAIAHHKFALGANYLGQIARKRSVLRAHELYSLGRESKARAEWVLSTQRMSDQERHAAAALALRWNLPNWSILALSKATNKNDLELRFPVVHAQPILQEAKRNQLDPALVFAVTRQESAFVANARSSSGALGLMQLLPGTAQEVARKTQRPLKNISILFEPSTNIHLGSHYLRMMLDSNQNNPILATAAYNAGPGRVRKWLPTYNMSSDSWVETIPFKETREYVKNVMSYTIIYQQLLGIKSSPPRTLPLIQAANISPCTQNIKQ